MAQRVVIPGFRKIETSGGGEGGTTNYNDLTNKPSINNVPLVGNLNTANLKLTDATLTEEGVPAEAKTVGAKLAEQSSNLTSEISRAKETEETLKSRIDNIASLPEGSTTGDAELQDIRVKADGTTATSAGNAVREQFSELKGDLVDISSSMFDKKFLEKHIVAIDKQETQIVLYDNPNTIIYSGSYKVKVRRTSGNSSIQLDYISNLKRKTIFVLSENEISKEKIINILDNESVGILMYYANGTSNEFDLEIERFEIDELKNRNGMSLILNHKANILSDSDKNIVPFFADFKSNTDYKFIIKSDMNINQTDGSISFNDDVGNKIFEQTISNVDLSVGVEVEYHSNSEIKNTPIFLYFINSDIGTNINIEMYEYDKNIGLTFQRLEKTFKKSCNSNGTTTFNYPFKSGKYYEIKVIFDEIVDSSFFGMLLSHYDDNDFSSNCILISPNKYKGNGFIRRFKVNTDEDYNYLVLATIDIESDVNISIKEIDDITIPSTVTLSANDSSFEDKSVSNFVCNGNYDEYIINMAIEYASSNKLGIIHLCNGMYHIQSFPFDTPKIDGGIVKTAIVLPKNELELTIRGASCKYGFTYKMFNNGVRIYVDNVGYNSIINEECAIFRSKSPTSRVSGSLIKMYDLGICTYGSQRKIIALDFTGVDRIYCERINIVGYINEMLNNTNVGLNVPPTDVPINGFVGVKMGTGSNDPQGYSFKNIGVWGFYEGFQVGGEHTVMELCSSTLCVYGYTFGNYEYGDNPNTIVHPITMINCCDERNQNFPLFKKCGFNQEITMIGFNIEQITSHTPAQTFNNKMICEGNFCGFINYTIMSGYSSDETGGNVKDYPLWEDGNGKTFKSVNSAHLMMGTSKERLSYAPNYNQQYFDTDLNKMVVCIQPSIKKWVDMNGNLIN